MTSDPRLTILFDNYPYVPGLTSLWGLAALIRSAGRTILFDTGSNGRVLLRNMAVLELSPTSVDLVFLSHPHWDHIGGLDSLLEVSPTVTVVVHEGFPRHLIKDLDSLCAETIVVGADPQPIVAGIFSTGMLDIRALQALGVDFVLPTHCTGDAAKSAFQRAYGSRCINGGVGRAVDTAGRRG